MSEEQMKEQTMSSEDKFFGVKTTIGGEKVDVDVEVVDDRPPEDRRPPAKEAKQEDFGDDEELEGYSEKVKKRINKLRYQQHEERRQREAAEKMREEAVRVAQKYADENKKYHAIIQEGEQYLVHQIRERANLQLEQAKAQYRQAYEEGNTDKVVEAQEAMMRAQAEFSSADQQFNHINQNREQWKQWQQQQARMPQQPQPQPRPQQPPQPTEKAAKWAQENPWFGQEKDMTALAYGVHERLVRDEGYDPNSDEYFEAIDRTMRSKFPEYFGDDASEGVFTTKSPPVVTAPSSRNNGAKPRKVRLTRTQLSLAKRLGLTPEQYANQLVKEAQ